MWYVWNFNISLTNNVVRCEQPGLGFWLFLQMGTAYVISYCLVLQMTQTFQNQAGLLLKGKKNWSGEAYPFL